MPFEISPQFVPLEVETEQQFFDRAVAHVRQQGVPSFNRTPSACAYRGPEGTHHRESTLKIKTEAFREALTLASRAASSVGVLDILRFARIEAKDGRLTLACNNLTMYAEAWADCGPGTIECCVRADRLSAALCHGWRRHRPHAQGQHAHLEVGRGRYQMSTLPVAKTSRCRSATRTRWRRWKATLAESLKRVVFSCATKDFASTCSGVLIECVKGKARDAGGDGRRKARRARHRNDGCRCQRDPAPRRHQRSAGRRGARAAVRAKRGVRLLGRAGRHQHGRRRVPGMDARDAERQARRKRHRGPQGAALVDQGGAPLRRSGGDPAAAERPRHAGGGGVEAASAPRWRCPAKGDGKVDAWFYSAAISPAIQAARGDALT
jgi:hypothetical protein